jgi:hypothetical protein
MCCADGQRARRHPRDEGVVGVLDDHAAAGLGDRERARRAVVQGAGQHDRHRGGAPGAGQGAEHRVGGGADAVLLRPTAELDPVRADQEVVIGPRDVDRAGLQRRSVLGQRHVQRGRSVEDRRQQAAGGGGDVQDDADRRVQVPRERGDEPPQRLDAARGRGHADDACGPRRHGRDGVRRHAQESTRPLPARLGRVRSWTTTRDLTWC